MHKITTVKGYSLFDCSSAFQKSVRRGLENEAMYWAVEAFESSYDEYIWKRIRIIASEDIGLAEPNIAANINALYQNYSIQKKKKDDKNRPERLFYTHAILMICRAKKSRVVDNSLIYFWETHYNEKREVPEFAYDKHTTKGRSMKRSWKHFFEEGTLLNNMAEIEGEAEMKEAAFLAITSENAKRQEKATGQKKIF
jgi:replication-associated recombination protein RarA